MPTCFLCYSSTYKELKEPFRRLLEAVGFTRVDVFDGPDLEAVSEVVKRKMKDADAVIILYGPGSKPTNTSDPGAPAYWPSAEAHAAWGMSKPIAMVIHDGLAPPEALANSATHPRFDFWDRESFLQNVHQIVKHLLDFRNHVTTLANRKGDVGVMVVPSQGTPVSVKADMFAADEDSLSPDDF